ncbi:MAG: redox-regulated ATPase YchF [bacterium (Candidatus Ratteibacteria) CG01_land_8_20_14_3_00_40_19]|uniref:Redox-regulated ATPase YchF n=2 Tax=Candidatus Ratteibacteria TaxID=2979319 RepID=A0A2M7E795_9BACT|nr:MAG: hypothetical protein AUJ76_02405 [Candidatus Omnitrophica bacterium CG1_02_41_171]PIV63610.1 MAG: redox-regulated ATPase YchF [bacterium (Candidatus Ratteibacteria) CG01_land_8_20_14_3_00_40_19]PIW31995.1 MAG: redox-regulated ATPase YchF [bacterium (Candidatus Ratteibacteria) CG15_BIG_FIL_POST_REV_8_21_14_020_41_12]HCG76918.1 redox-regulated ATPase YchF [bacterium]
MIAFFGFAGSGKTSFFQALARSEKESYAPDKPLIGEVKLPDERLKFLAEKLESKKVTFPSLTFLDLKGANKEEGFPPEMLAQLKDARLLIYCLKEFGEDCNCSDDLESLELELICYDLELAEKRLSSPQENSSVQTLLKRCQEASQNGIPLRDLEFSENEKKILCEIPFLSFKKAIILINKEKEALSSGNRLPPLLFKPKGKEKIPIFSLSALMEKEISQLPPPEKNEYLKKIGLAESPLIPFTKEILNSLSLITFYTAVKNEARAWLIPEKTPAIRAAGKIHTDMEKGFIRAEVLGFEDFQKAGSLASAKHQNLTHSENKEYLVRDGEIIEFLFTTRRFPN